MVAVSTSKLESLSRHSTFGKKPNAVYKRTDSALQIEEEEIKTILREHRLGLDVVVSRRLRSTQSSCRILKSHNRTLVVFSDSSTIHQKHIKINRALVTRFEMDLHCQHGFCCFSHFGRPNHSTVVRRSITLCCGGSLCWLSFWHVVAINLHSVDVRNDSIAVAELRFDGGHIGSADKTASEVLRPRRVDGGRCINPTIICKGILPPAVLKRTSVLPGISFTNGGVERKEITLIPYCGLDCL